MAQETKSNGQKDVLDRFYTADKTVDLCLSNINMQSYNQIIEPSAGSGSFSNKIPNCLAYDIAPMGENIIEADWLTLSKKDFQSNTLVIGNPPFGQQNSLAIKFINESAKFARTIAFILPLSFKKDSVKNKIDENFILQKEIDLIDCVFYLHEKPYIVPCVFQIWERSKTKRKKKILKTQTKLFSFVDKTQADFRIQRVGGNAGKAFLDLNKSKQSNYFIKNLSSFSNQDLINIINSLEYPSIEWTVGPKSLSKGELIECLEEKILDDRLENIL